MINDSFFCGFALLAATGRHCYARRCSYRFACSIFFSVHLSAQGCCAAEVIVQVVGVIFFCQLVAVERTELP